MELTKEYFDKQLKQLATKKDLAPLPLIHGLLKDALRDLDTIRADLQAVRAALTALSDRDDEDTRATIKDLSRLKRTVKELSAKVRRLELKYS